jgi:hypothetical protein
MAVTGTLNADFSQFYTAAAKAEVSLKGMEGGAVKVEQALGNMAGGSTVPMNSFRDSIGQVDQALAATGINIGKYARGIAEIGEMSGKTVSQLGLLASGASVVAAAMAGWNIGRATMEFFGLDAAVQKTWASLLGLETAAQGSASATREFLKGIQEQNDAYAVSAQRIADAQKAVRGLSDATRDAIAIAKQAGATDAEITRVYGVSADALKVLAAQKKLTADQADIHAAAIKREAAASKAYDVEIANQIVLFDNLNKAAAASQNLKASNNAAAGWIAQQVAVKKGIDDEAAATRAYLTEQEALTAATDALSVAHTTAGTAAVSATAGAVAGYAGVAQQVQISGDAVKEWIALMQYAAQANAINRRNSLFQTTSQAEALASLSGPALSPGATAGAFRGGGGASVVNNFSIVDTEANIAKRVSDHITRSVMQAVPLGA